MGVRQPAFSLLRFSDSAFESKLAEDSTITHQGSFMPSSKSKIIFLAVLLSSTLFMLGCSGSGENSYAKPKQSFGLYSKVGREHQVQFEGEYLTSIKQLDQLQPKSLISEIKSTTQFLAGPLTERHLAGIQKGAVITPHIDKAYLKNGRAMVPYTYVGVWLIHTEYLTSPTISIPVPFSIQDLKTEKWKNCTASEADHSDWDFFWYFWDPSRSGCDHQLGENYQEAQVQIGTETVPTTISYPEYKNLIQIKNGQATMAMTFAFGYVEDISNPNPFKDIDEGIVQFQKFYGQVKKQLEPLGFTEIAIYQNEITSGNTVIGARFNGIKNNVHVEVSVIAAAGIDQMDLFADSYAKKHDGFFAWFGHSRVGGGFDAYKFQQNLQENSDVFSLSLNYQIIYWAGCNSYAYYTLPFFKLKADMNPSQDSTGTKKLDIISNGLPSLFSFNAYNARVLFQALLQWEKPTSYQSIINKIESHATSQGSPVIVNVIGDEDNLQ